LIHRAVAEAFLENPNEYPVINHKDENPLNNIVENIEWCDYSYNNSYNNKAKRFSRKKKVFQYNSEGILIHTYESVREVSRILNVPYSNIYECCYGSKRKKERITNVYVSHDYVFSYVELSKDEVLWRFHKSRVA